MAGTGTGSCSAQCVFQGNRIQELKEYTMRQLFSVCTEAASRMRTVTNRKFCRGAGILAAAGAVCLTSQAFGQADAKSDRNQSADSTQKDSSVAAEPAIPECMEKLKLTEDQQTKAKAIIGAYDQKLNAVWKQFSVKYMATIRTECLLLAAVEDGLTESQRTAVHTLRRSVAHAEKALEGTNSSTNQSTEKPADAIEEAVAGTGITLTAEQETAAERIQQNYSSHLRSLNRDVEGLHNRLVSLEADKLVELEKVLTKTQLAELRESRQMTTGAPKVTAVRN